MNDLERVDCSQKHFVNHLILWLLAFIIMSPVLLHPHWGMFSDSRQIVWTNKTLYAHPSQIALWVNTICADFRPGFHLINVVLWTLSANRPLGYYLFRFACFSVTLSLTYANCQSLAHSKTISLICTTFLLCSYATFEVIYTLDKGELYVGALFSLIIYLHLSTVNVLRNNRANRSWVKNSIVLFLACLYALFTKQTGQLLLVFGIITALNSFIQRYLRVKNEPLFVRLKRLFALSDPESKWCNYVCVCSLLGVFIYKTFSMSYSGIAFKYTHSVWTADFIASHIALYAQGIPEIFFVMAAAVVGLFWVVCVQKLKVIEVSIVDTISLLVTTGCGAVALCAWESNLAYIWYPLLPFLLPSMACIIGWLEVRTRQVFQFLLILVMLLQIPSRLVDAQTQFAMDSAFNKVTKMIAEMPAKLRHPVNVVLNLRMQISEEIGEEIKYAVAKEFDRAATSTPGATLNENVPPLKIWNIISESTGDPGIDAKTFTLPPAFVPGYAAKPGFNKLIYREDEPIQWAADNLKIGDILLVPYGTVRLKPLGYRGVDLFIRSWQAVAESMPQLGLEPVFTCETDDSCFSALVRGSCVGWAALEVTQAPAFTLPLQHFGWLPNDCRIYFAKDLVGKTLVLNSKGSFLSSIIDNQDRSRISIAGKKGTFIEFDVPLKAGGAINLCAEDSNFKRPVLLHVDNVLIRN